MLSRADPVLTVAFGNLQKLQSIDETDIQTIWNVFTKCKDNLENGHRLENISWRLWYRSCHGLPGKDDIEEDIQGRMAQTDCLKVPAPRYNSDSTSLGHQLSLSPVSVSRILKTTTDLRDPKEEAVAAKKHMMAMQAAAAASMARQQQQNELLQQQQQEQLEQERSLRQPQPQRSFQPCFDTTSHDVRTSGPSQSALLPDSRPSILAQPTLPVVPNYAAPHTPIDPPPKPLQYQHTIRRRPSQPLPPAEAPIPPRPKANFYLAESRSPSPAYLPRPLAPTPNRQMAIVCSDDEDESTASELSDSYTDSNFSDDYSDYDEDDWCDPRFPPSSGSAYPLFEKVNLEDEGSSTTPVANKRRSLLSHAIKVSELKRAKPSLRRDLNLLMTVEGVSASIGSRPSPYPSAGSTFSANTSHASTVTIGSAESSATIVAGGYTYSTSIETPSPPRSIPQSYNHTEISADPRHAEWTESLRMNLETDRRMMFGARLERGVEFVGSAEGMFEEDGVW